ncbi:hypothetical protein GN958_ATG16917, partial [Phytophthora infestans]
FEPFGPGNVKLYEQANFDKVVLHTSTGPLNLRNLECWINESDETCAMTVGRSVMVALGYSTDGLLATALEKQPEYVLPTGNNVSESPLMRAQQLREVVCFDEAATDRTKYFLPDTTRDKRTTESVSDHLLSAIQEAQSKALHGHAMDMLKSSLERHTAAFCVFFGMNPPVKVPPMRVQLQPHATPSRCSARRYASVERAFMDAHVAELEDLALVYENYNCRWAAAPSMSPSRLLLLLECALT